MDATDSAIQRELTRRLEIVEREGGTAHSSPLPSADLMIFVLIVVVAALVGMIAGGA